MEINWSDDSDDHYDLNHERSSIDHPSITLREQSQSCITSGPKTDEPPTITCPSCGHKISRQANQVGIVIKDLPSLPAGVKFDPSDSEILMHLEAKVLSDRRKLHPLIDEFIPTLEGENGICYTHPEKLPGVSKDGQVRHFFHRPSKAYTTGTRKRRKVSTDEQGNETRWHKTGKTRPVQFQGAFKGFKKILVLYTNYGRQKKPEKTNWVMHQYHLGHDEDEKDGELVLSKVFYQTQPRQCGPSTAGSCSADPRSTSYTLKNRNAPVVAYNRGDLQVLGFEHGGHSKNRESHQIHELMVHEGDVSSSFLRFTSDASKSEQSFMKNQ